MELVKAFHQSELIQNTGKKYPNGVCLGLVAQWLISINHTLSDENQFWSDLENSLAEREDVPLLGVGYARQAIEFQGEYAVSMGGGQSTGEYTRKVLKDNGLTLDNAVAINNGAFTAASEREISDKALNKPGRYSILGIMGANGAHAIGIHRSYKVGFGKSNDLQVFDPNIGKYTCSGQDDMIAVLADIADAYNGGLNNAYLFENYNS